MMHSKKDTRKSYLDSAADTNELYQERCASNQLLEPNGTAILIDKIVHDFLKYCLTIHFPKYLGQKEVQFIIGYDQTFYRIRD